MERLTKDIDGVICYVGNNRRHDEDIPAEISTSAVREVLTKLARYEEAEEQERLIILPHKIGDRVFLAQRGKVRELEIKNVTCNVYYTQDIENGYRDVDIYPNDFGRYVFNSREEAERVLQEVKNG